MFMLIGWCDGFGNDAYVKSVYATREEAIQNAEDDDNYPDKLIEFNFGEEIDFDYYSGAEDIFNHNEEKEIDWLLVACVAVDNEYFNQKHSDWIPDYSDGKDAVDDLVVNHIDWLREFYERDKDYFE